ncbi:MAG: hypothetical protein AAB152_17855 [Candidatus Coatesbacteria bacterium]
MKRALLATLVLCMLVAESRVLAAEPIARGAAIGSAYGTLAGGAEGLWWNPAVLGSPILGSAALGLTLQGGNNALTLNQLRGIVQDDATAKAEAVTAIEKKGRWDTRVEAVGGAAVSVMGFSVGVAPRIIVEALNVSPLLAKVALLGNVTLQPNSHYDVTGENLRAVYNEIAIGYAHDLPIPVPGLSLSGGLAIKYYQGSDFERWKTDQHIDTGATASGSIASSTHETATQGTGYGVDLGLRGTVAGIVKCAIVVKNIGGAITWTGKTESSNLNAAKTAFVTTTTLGDIKEKLPTQVTVGASASIPVVGTAVAAALDVRTNPSETRAKVGLEQSIAILALRVGYVTAAGPEPGMLTFGVGLGALVARLDVAAGVSAGNKGGMLGASGTVSF